MQLVTIGTGAGAPRLDRGGPCTLVICGDSLAAVDLGLGALHGVLRTGAGPDDLDAVLFTHLHPDHTAELCSLLFAANYAEPPRLRPLLLAGGPGFPAFLDRLRATHGHWLEPRSYTLQVRELGVGSELALGPGLWRCGPARHIPSSLSYRIEAGSRCAVLSGDTGPTSELEAFAHGADLLLLEASLAARTATETDVRHLTAGEAGTLARRAGVACLVLNHLTPSSEAGNPGAAAAKAFGGSVTIAYDGLRLRA